MDGLAQVPMTGSEPVPAYQALGLLWEGGVGSIAGQILTADEGRSVPRAWAEAVVGGLGVGGPTGLGHTRQREEGLG